MTINHGRPFTTRQARELGLTPRLLRQVVGEGALRRVLRTVYVDASTPDTRQTRLAAVSLVKPAEAIACNETAAWLHGLTVFAPGERHLLEPHLVVPHATTRVERDDVRCRQAIIDAEDVCDADGILLTTPVRTASDLLRRMYRPYALAAADAFAHRGLITRDELIDYVAKRKGYRGIVQARSLARLVDPKSQSPGESWQRLRIHDAGFPPPESQFEVTDDFGRTYFLDHAYPEVLIGTEYDGMQFHTDEHHRLHDQQRRNYLSELFGWRWCLGTRERLFGNDMAFEEELGSLLGIAPLPRRWGYGR